MSGKGSKPRPFSIDLETFNNNWDVIFKNKDSTEKVLQDQVSPGGEMVDTLDLKSNAR